MTTKERREHKPRKHVAAYYPVMAVTIAIEFLLALSAAFLIDGTVVLICRNLLDGLAADLLSQVIAAALSLILGVCFMVAGIWTFSGFMRTKYDFVAWAKRYNADWAAYLPHAIAGAIVALDWVTLGYRAAFLSSRGEAWLLAFFALLPPLVWGLGIFIYIAETIPEDQQLANLRQELEQVHVGELKEAAYDMDPEELSRWMGEDADAITDYHARTAQEREEARQRELDAMAVRDQQVAAAQPKPLPLPNKRTFLGPLRDTRRNA
jgi:hypothetical protein